MGVAGSGIDRSRFCGAVRPGVGFYRRLVILREQ
jgi:hypothetical protein